MNLNEYIELQQNIYGLEEESKNKIKTKILRTLKNNPEWKKLVSEQRKIKKQKSTELNENIIIFLNENLKKYFFKISKLNLKDVKKQKKINEIESMNLENDFLISYKEEYDENYITNDLKIKVMIEAIFNENFYIDIKSWNKDLKFYNVFCDDSEVLKSEEMAIIRTKLNNPTKFYVKKKK